MDLNQQFLQIALGGATWVLWVLVGLSLASAAVIVERLVYYRVVARREQLLAEAVSLGASWTKLRRLAQSKPSPGARMLKRTLQAMAEGARNVGLVSDSVRAAEKVRLETNLGLLGTVGANAPFVGLLGTVLEILRVFHILGEQGVTSTQDASAIMTGISEALVATGVGLLVAIPATIAYNAFLRKVGSLLSQAQETASVALGLPAPAGGELD